jgi:hypothetical protein
MTPYPNKLKKTDFTVTEMPELDLKTMVSCLSNDYTGPVGTPKIQLTDDARLICKSTVSGYSLKLKKWRTYILIYFPSNIVTNNNLQYSSSLILSKKSNGMTTPSPNLSSPPTPKTS